jgi:ABC-type transporter Mla subunit MlaD
MSPQLPHRSSGVSQSLSRLQAAALGLVVVAAVTLGGYGVVRIADKQGAWADTIEVSAGFSEAHDITPGTPVRLRGVDAGQVVAVEYPDHDGPGAEVTVRMRLQAKYASRLYADASAQVHGTGMLGSKVIAVQPGDPKKGVLADGRLRGVKPFQLEDAVAEVRDLAKEAKGTATEVKQLATETRATVAAARAVPRRRAGERRHARQAHPRRRPVRGRPRRARRPAQAGRPGRQGRRRGGR